MSGFASNWDNMFVSGYSGAQRYDLAQQELARDQARYADSEAWRRLNYDRLIDNENYNRQQDAQRRLDARDVADAKAAAAQAQAEAEVGIASAILGQDAMGGGLGNAFLNASPATRRLGITAISRAQQQEQKAKEAQAKRQAGIDEQLGLIDELEQRNPGSLSPKQLERMRADANAGRTVIKRVTPQIDSMGGLVPSTAERQAESDVRRKKADDTKARVAFKDAQIKAVETQLRPYKDMIGIGDADIPDAARPLLEQLRTLTHERAMLLNPDAPQVSENTDMLNVVAPPGPDISSSQRREAAKAHDAQVSAERKSAIIRQLLSDPAWASKSDEELAAEVDRRAAQPKKPPSVWQRLGSLPLGIN